ncbi:MAG: porin family protein [Rickettsiales bacterium]|nr:porin family protein [Rickettsiales bacterium]
MRRNKILMSIAISSLLITSEVLACGSKDHKADAAHCQFNKNYIRVDAGFDMLAKNPNSKDYSKKPKGTPVYGVGFGYQYNPDFRGDVTVTYRSNFKYSGHNATQDKETQKIQSTAFMLNAYYDILNYQGFTPYVMAGAGSAYNKAGKFTQQGIASVKSASKNQLAWQVGVGAQHEITKSIAADLGYKYVNLGKVTTATEYVSATGTHGFGNAVTGKLRSHEVLLGIAYKF